MHFSFINGLSITQQVVSPNTTIFIVVLTIFHLFIRKSLDKYSDTLISLKLGYTKLSTPLKKVQKNYHNNRIKVIERSIN